MQRLTRNALTVDLEDWYHPEYISEKVDCRCRSPMIEESALRTLRLLDELRIKSTFFVNGEIAEKRPHIIREIAHRGHEIASHGYSHAPLWKMTPNAFADEISRFNRIIKKAIGVAPIGFRAPSFSLSNKTIWALKILKEKGYLYDSSVFPLKTPLYGLGGVPQRPYYPSLDNLRLENPEEKLIEFPPLATSFLGIRVPAAGGFYFRILPESVVRHAVTERNRNGYPAMLFFHPWELLESTPRLRLSAYRYVVSYLNLSRTEKQIRSLAKTFRFAPVRDVLKLG